MPATYLTICKPSQSLFKEKGSKFIGLAIPVFSENDVREKLQQLKQEYYDARHHCYGFVIGPEKKLYRCSDAGEPAHTAGSPILGQIRSRDLTNVLVVVIRYFGGTKLGVPGLIAAYKAAAAQALDLAGAEEKEERELIKVLFPYSALSQVMRLQKEYQAEIVNTGFQADCNLELSASKSNVSQLLSDLGNLRNLGVIIECE